MTSSFQVPVLTQTNFSGLKLRHRGKVRDIYEFDDSLLLVATDRLSAYDVIMAQGIPFKGKVLTKISEFWFEQMNNVAPNHILSTIVYDYPSACKPYWSELEDRSMLVKKTKALPVECVVRGYLSGSGWEEYKATGSICNIRLPAGLIESDRLPEPIFTPATKEEVGKHDQNISFERMGDLVGGSVAAQAREYSLAIYRNASEIAQKAGMIIADTKMEFGIDDEGKLIIIDELLTPDSSRFWPTESYKPGRSQKSFDKQFVRDYLVSVGFNKRPPPPRLPEEVIFKTSALYLEALKRLTGRSLL
jgi:phosphoribosylaminoimidazole-succinocarboxamide synthase